MGESMDENGPTLQAMAQEALSEIAAVFKLVADDAAERMYAEILKARRIACYVSGAKDS